MSAIEELRRQLAVLRIGAAPATEFHRGWGSALEMVIAKIDVLKSNQTRARDELAGEMLKIILTGMVPEIVRQGRSLENFAIARMAYDMADAMISHREAEGE